MKKLTFILILIIMAISTIAQIPHKFKYQTVVRDVSGQLLSLQNVAFKISMVKDSINGTIVYSETHDVITNQFGLANFAVGAGTILSGNFEDINWYNGAYFLQIEVDITGGINYQLLGTSQLLAVPYSIHTKRTDGIIVVDSVVQLDSISNPVQGMIISSINETKNDGTPEVFLFDGTNWIPFLIRQGTNIGDILYWNGTQWTTVPVGSQGDVLTMNNGIPGWGSPEKIPSVYTEEITGITPYAASSGGCLNDGGLVITSKGVCWSKSPNPTISDSLTNDGSGSECFTSNLINLDSNTTYYVRAYAINPLGTGYGDEEVFNTLRALPSVNTSDYITDITPYSATIRCTINNDWGFPITTSGVCWSTSPNPDTSDFKTTDGTSTGNYYSYLTGLSPGTLYYVRAYAINAAGTGYGNDQELTTKPSSPYISTWDASNITAHTAEAGGYVIEDWGFPVTARGVCWSLMPDPDTSDFKTSDGSGTGGFDSYLTGLTLNTLYYHRAYAISSEGVGYGNEESFTTQDGVVQFYTITVHDITAYSATSGGDIYNDGGSPITTKGVCWSTSQNPTIANDTTVDGSGSDTYFSNLTGLLPGTTYYVRAYAVNAAGTSYADVLSFTTGDGTIILSTEPVTNIMGTNATSGGDFINNGGMGMITKGICWSTSPNPTIADNHTNDGDGTGSYVSVMSGLSFTTLYYVRAYATNVVGTFYGDELSFTTADIHSIGEIFGGGVIFYLDGTSLHGLIVAPSNFDTDASWGCPGTYISTSWDIGTGASNTAAILNDCSTPGIAAHICDTSALNGYTDWFLPSRGELDEVYDQLELIGIEWDSFWSSSASGSDNAYYLSYFGNWYSSYKGIGRNVLAIREF